MKEFQDTFNSNLDIITRDHVGNLISQFYSAFDKTCRDLMLIKRIVPGSRRKIQIDIEDFNRYKRMRCQAEQLRKINFQD